MKFEIVNDKPTIERILKATLKTDQEGNLIICLNTIEIAYINCSGRLIRLRHTENMRDILQTLGVSIDANGRIETN